MYYDERLREFDLDDSFEGKRWHDDYAANFATWEERFTKALPGSENRRDVMKRMGEFLYDIESKYKGKRILIVSHGGPIATLRAAAAGMSVEQQKEDYDNGRYFGNAQWEQMAFTPLPHNDNYELDFHRPYIDEVALFDGETKLERVPDVFDCWFESGSMPFGQQHFLGDAKENFDPENGKGFPANFIAEGLDQTRGWFYSLIVLGTAIFGKSPYQNVIVNGLVLAEDGKKMSKSLQNYPDPVELADRTGVDAMRFYLLSSPIVRAEDLNFSEKEVLELQRKNIGRLNNVLTMYEMFADGTVANTDSKQVLDRWIVTRLNELIEAATAGYKNYELDKATRPVTDFIDDLSVWYLRRSRDRLKGSDTNDAALALGTLRYVLQELSKVMAPVMPFFAEQVYQAVKVEDGAESVHLETWPEGGIVDEELIVLMVAARSVVTQGLEARVKVGIKVRQPLATLKFPTGVLENLHGLIKDELNVKEIVVDDKVNPGEIWLDTEITPALKAEGDVRELMRSIQGMRKDAGMQQDDRVTLTIQATAEGRSLIEQFQADIQQTVGAAEVVFADTTGTQVQAGEHAFVVSLKKV